MNWKRIHRLSIAAAVLSIISGVAVFSLRSRNPVSTRPQDSSEIPAKALAGDSHARRKIEFSAAHSTLPSALDNTSVSREAIRAALAAVAPFDDWLLRLKRGEERKVSFMAEGLVLAQKRRAALKELIVLDPQAALAHAAPRALRATLPQAIGEQLETLIDADGEFELLAVDAKDAAWYLRRVRIDGTLYDTYTYGARLDTLTKDRLAINGIAIDNLLALPDLPYRLLEAAEYAEAQLDPAASIAIKTGGSIKVFASQEELKIWLATMQTAEFAIGPSITGQTPVTDIVEPYWVNGEKSVLWIQVDFSDDPGAVATEQQLRDSISAINTFYLNVSRNKTSFTGTIFPEIIRMPKTKAQYAAATNGDVEIAEEAYKAAKAYDTAHGGTGAYVSGNFDRRIVIFKGIDKLTYAGIASLAGKDIRLNGYYDSGTAGHELGHTQGLNHSHSWKPSGASPISTGQHVEYGDKYDIMGDSFSASDQHFNVKQKANLGYLASSEIQTVSQNGIYRLYRSDSRNASGIQALRVDAGTAYDYWIESRQQTRRKSTSAQVERTQKGVLIHWGKQPSFTEGTGTYLLDMTPTSADDMVDAPLGQGETFVDADHGITITPVASGGTEPTQWVDVELTFGAKGNNRNPVLAFDPPGGSQPVRSSVSLTASATDPDGDAVSYSWDFGDGTVVRKAPPLSHRWLTGGDYDVSVTVTDGRGGIASKTVKMTVEDPFLKWHKRGEGLTKSSLQAVVFADNRFVVVSSTSEKILVSDNGVIWTSVTGVSGHYYQGLIYGADRYMAVGSSMGTPSNPFHAAIVVSRNGIDWQDVSPTTIPTALFGVAYGAGHFVAVGGKGLLLQSTDGVSWSTVNLGVTSDLSSVAFAAGKFVACGADGLILTSTDGVEWRNQSTSDDVRFASVLYAKNSWWVTNGLVTYRSTDGLSWTKFTLWGCDTYISSLFLSKEGFMLSTSNKGKIFVTEDGTATNFYSVASTSLSSIAEGNDCFVCVGMNGSIFQAGKSPADTITFTQEPTSQFPKDGAKLSLSASASGVGALHYQWKKDGVAIEGATSSSFTINAAASGDAGNYTVMVTSDDGVSESSAASVSVGEPGHLTALAVLNQCGSGNDVLVAGYLIHGPGQKRMVIRGIGPNLLKSQLQSCLANPQLKVAPLGGEVQASNDDWSENDGSSYGPARLNTGSKDAALFVNQGAGAYSAVVSGVGDTTGTAMAEVYDTNPSDTDTRITALSVRARVGQGETVIPGLVVSGSTSRKVIIRAIGPSLAKLAVPNVLADPEITLYYQGYPVISNDDWSVEDGRSIGLMSLLSGSKDSVLVIDLWPGNFSIHVKDKNNNAGIVLIEIYEMP